jgi:hypothetical protein
MRLAAPRRKCKQHQLTEQEMRRIREKLPSGARYQQRPDKVSPGQSEA